MKLIERSGQLQLLHRRQTFHSVSHKKFKLSEAVSENPEQYGVVDVKICIEVRPHLTRHRTFVYSDTLFQCAQRGVAGFLLPLQSGV